MPLRLVHQVAGDDAGGADERQAMADPAGEVKPVVVHEVHAPLAGEAAKRPAARGLNQPVAGDDRGGDQQ
jgi:hypothetical protein